MQRGTFSLAEEKTLACILIADDEKIVVHTIRRILELAGHVVVVAQDGLDCEFILSESTPDLVVMDLLMPRQTGFETVERLRAHASNLKVLLISGGGYSLSTELGELARQCGADAALSKPFEPQQLLHAINDLLPSHLALSTV